MVLANAAHIRNVPGRKSDVNPRHLAAARRVATQAYFAGGLHEELLTQLAKVAAL